MVCLLTGPLLEVMLTRTSFGAPPFCHILYNNDMDLGLSSKVSKFADDTKLVIDATHPESLRALQGTLQPLENGSRFGRCPSTWTSAMSCTWAPPARRTIIGSAISSIDEENYLGVVITADLKSSAQYIAAEQKTQKILGYIKRVFCYRNEFP